VGTADAVAASDVPAPIATPEVIESSGDGGSESSGEEIEPVTTPEVTQ
jgi:hypothetical protein